MKAINIISKQLELHSVEQNILDEVLYFFLNFIS